MVLQSVVLILVLPTLRFWWLVIANVVSRFGWLFWLILVCWSLCFDVCGFWFPAFLFVWVYVRPGLWFLGFMCV